MSAGSGPRALSAREQEQSGDPAVGDEFRAVQADIRAFVRKCAPPSLSANRGGTSAPTVHVRFNAFPRIDAPAAAAHGTRRLTTGCRGRFKTEDVAERVVAQVRTTPSRPGRPASTSRLPLHSPLCNF
jgi:hypothetical protein